MATYECRFCCSPLPQKEEGGKVRKGGRKRLYCSEKCKGRYFRQKRKKEREEQRKAEIVLPIVEKMRRGLASRDEAKTLMDHEDVVEQYLGLGFAEVLVIMNELVKSPRGLDETSRLCVESLVKKNKDRGV